MRQQQHRPEGLEAYTSLSCWLCPFAHSSLTLVPDCGWYFWLMFAQRVRAVECWKRWMCVAKLAFYKSAIHWCAPCDGINWKESPAPSSIYSHSLFWEPLPLTSSPNPLDSASRRFDSMKSLCDIRETRMCIHVYTAAKRTAVLLRMQTSLSS